MLSWAPAIERLGIPAYNWWSEGIHGVGRAGTATVFPQAIGMAAAFDPDMMHKVGETVGVESPRQVQHVPQLRRPRHLQGPDRLGPQHQHLPRPALGPRP